MLVRGIASNLNEALLMPADVAIWMLKDGSPAEKEKPRDKMETMPDGSKRMSFGSLESLSAALKGANWPGIKVGDEIMKR